MYYNTLCYELTSSSCVVFCYRSVLTDVQKRVTDARAGTSGQADTSEIVRHLQEVKSHFGGMQSDMKTLLSKPQVSKVHLQYI